ncbi:MAG: HdeD family acid-resistance protein [Sphaerochaetaceae bacterium]
MQDTFFKRHLIISIIIGALVSAVGIFLMFQQDSFMKIFISLLGIILAGSGVSNLVTLKGFGLGNRSRVMTIVKALLSIVVGLIALIVPLSAATISWTVLLYIIGIQLLFSAGVSFLDAILLRKSDRSLSPLFTEGIFSLVVAILLFVFPQQIGSMLLKLFGLLFIVSGIGMILWSLRIRKINRQFKEQVIESEAEIVDPEN